MNNLISIFKEVIYLGATSSVLILIILLVKKIFKRALSPKWHYYIWVLLIIRLVVPFSPESPVSIYSLLNAVTNKVNLNVGEIINIQNPIGTNENLPRLEESSKGEKNADVPSNNTTLTVKKEPKYNSVMMVTAIIWAVGVLLFSLYTIFVNLAFAVNIHKTYTPLKDERINGILEECKKLMKIRRYIPLLNSKKLRTPALYGFISAKILVSKQYIEQLSDAEIKYIFLHELSHYKRKDILVNWILTVLQIVYFFNPLLWYAFKRVHEDCEISCDASALRYVKEEEYHSYGNTIIKLIRLYSESNFIPITAGIAKNKSSYKRRIIMISKFRKSKWTNTALALVLITAVGFIGLTGCKISKVKDPASQTVVAGDKGNNETPESQQEENNQIGTGTDKSANNETSQSNEDKEVFYGDWVITKVLAYGSVGTYSKEDAEGLIGKSLSFSKDKANFFGDEASYINEVATNPMYKISTLSKEDFIANYQMTLDKLGVTGDSITEVVVSDSKAPVSIFFIKDENTLVIVGGGTYFELGKM